MGLSQDDYKNLSVIASLLTQDRKYGGYRVEANEWKKFVSEIADEAEFDGAVLLRNICGSSKRYYIRLGPKRQGYNQMVSMQINSGKQEPPRTPGVTIERCKLQRVLLWY